MTSMKVRLYALVLLATSVVWFCGMAWIYSGSRKTLETVLDSRLEEATRMVGSLIENADVKVTTDVSGVRMSNKTTKALSDVGTNFRLACQIWTIGGELMGKSSEAPATQLTHFSNGYSNQEINGARWRVFARADKERGIRVLVGDNIDHRERLVRELIWGLVLPGLVVLAILSGLLWVAIREGLAPLRRLTGALKQRSADDLGPVEIGRTPAEMRPVMTALNGLLEQVVDAREHERSVTAFAAHELRTPLAGLRTQVQVALAASDPATRDAALKNAMVAADRTTRMARQLLALAQIDAADRPAPREWIDVGTRLGAICDELRTKDNPCPAVVDAQLFGCKIKVDPDAFHIAARNLTENAIQHSPRSEPVRWTVTHTNGTAILAVEDCGPGIPPDEIEIVTKRFYRGRHKSALGSGLGLAIVETALAKDGMNLRLENRLAPATGLRAQILVAADRAKPAHQCEPHRAAPITVTVTAAGAA